MSTYFTRLPWEWLATLTVDDGVNFFTALKLFNRWCLRLVGEENLRIGG